MYVRKSLDKPIANYLCSIFWKELSWRNDILESQIETTVHAVDSFDSSKHKIVI